jgi:Transposase IS4
VPYLLKLLPMRPIESPYIVWLDNLFSSTKLFSFLRKEGFGATGTARTNSGICLEFVQKKRLDKAKDIEPWGKLYSAPTIGNDVVQFAWKDNGLVLFLSTTRFRLSYLASSE